MIRLVILGEPVPKARATPRVSKNGKRYSFTPSKTVEAEDRIRNAWVDAGKPYIEGRVPLLLSFICYRTKPKSAKKSELWPLQKPDLKNLLWLIEDALSGFAFGNDSQIVGFQDCWKRYCAPGEPPRTEIRIEPIAQEAVRGAEASQEALGCLF